MSKCQKFRVEGRVQGVWFRESTRQQANLLRLGGHAINRLDGSVEVLACGEPESLDALAEWLWDGPPMARVISVTKVAYEGVCPSCFTTS